MFLFSFFRPVLLRTTFVCHDLGGGRYPWLMSHSSRFPDVDGRLGDEPRAGEEGALSMLEGEEGERADDDYAKGEPSVQLLETNGCVFLVGFYIGSVFAFPPL